MEHEIVSLPSASTLAVMRREMAERKSPAKAVAVLADPVFEKDDPRVKLGIRDQGLEIREQSTSTKLRSRSSNPQLRAPNPKSPTPTLAER